MFLHLLELLLIRIFWQGHFKKILLSIAEVLFLIRGFSCVLKIIYQVTPKKNLKK